MIIASICACKWVELIKTFMYFEFSECTISQVPSGSNAVADTLVAVGLNTDGPLLWQDSVASLVSRSTINTLKGAMLSI